MVEELFEDVASAAELHGARASAGEQNKNHLKSSKSFELLKVSKDVVVLGTPRQTTGKVVKVLYQHRLDISY